MSGDADAVQKLIAAHVNIDSQAVKVCALSASLVRDAVAVGTFCTHRVDRLHSTLLPCVVILRLSKYSLRLEPISTCWTRYCTCVVHLCSLLLYVFIGMMMGPSGRACT